MGVLTWSPLASGFLSGRNRKGRPVDLSTGRAALTPARFDPAIPENAVKLDVVERRAPCGSPAPGARGTRVAFGIDLPADQADRRNRELDLTSR